MKILLLFLPFFLFANVKKEIIKFYKKHYPTIEIISIKSNKLFPKKYKKIDFRLANYKMPSSTLIIDGKYYYFQIKAKIKVFKAIRIIKVNEFIKPNVKEEFINFRSFYSKPLTKIDDNLIASKIISKNAIINENNTKIKPLILKNEIVNVIFQNSNIEIISRGQALNDANINDTLKVNINGKIYIGTVDKNANVIIR